MSRPSGTCPVCKKPLREEDDIVICPSCGAPYHRECYSKVGQCIFADRHKNGFEYEDITTKKETVEKKAGKGEEKHTGGEIRCPKCSTLNKEGNIFCERCGAPLHSGFSADTKRNAGAENGGILGGGPAGWGAGATGYGPGMDVSGEIDGISKKDWVSFIGPSAPTYLYRLSAQQTRKNKFSFMLSAFFISPLYFAYRKMWGWAVAAFLSLTVLAVPNYLAIMNSGGLALASWLTPEILDGISLAATYISFALQLLFGFLALYFYRRQASRKMHILKETNPDTAAYQAALLKAGGVSTAGVATVALAYVALYVVVYVNFGQYLLNWFALTA